MPKTPRLRELREKAGMTQEDLEGLSGVTRHTISNLERGMQSAHARTARKLAGALGVAVRELQEDEPPQQSPYRNLEVRIEEMSEEIRSGEDSLDPDDFEVRLLELVADLMQISPELRAAVPGTPQGELRRRVAEVEFLLRESARKGRTELEKKRAAAAQDHTEVAAQGSHS
jgi:transcriptional regulator with XRE-family HTH domain